jgi:hypothetical protein
VRLVLDMRIPPISLLCDHHTAEKIACNMLGISEDDSIASETMKCSRAHRTLFEANGADCYVLDFASQVVRRKAPAL